MRDILNFKNCPDCGSSWEGEDIYEAFRKHVFYKDKTDAELKQYVYDHYKWSEQNKKSFKRVIGIEIQGQYDGVSYFQCPDCRQTYNRFTGEKEDLPALPVSPSRGNDLK